MKRLSVLAVLLVLFVLSSSADRRRSVRVPVNNDLHWLTTAIETGAWLESIAQVRGEGLAWGSDAAQPTAVTPGLPGTSGAGFFFLRLYQVTHEPRYLGIAQRAATYVASTCANFGFDWQAGTVGCGEFLVALARETHEPQQLERAKLMADALLQRAKHEGDGTYWVFPSSTTVYTGVAHGAGGVAVLLLDVYELTGDRKYLDAAESAWRWIAKYNVNLGANAVGWKRLTTDTTSYNGWCGGASGIIFVLDRLFTVTGKSEYRDQLAATASGLLTTAVQTDSGYRWTYYSDRTGNSPLVYCHGSACAIGSLARAYELGGDARFLAMAVAGAAHLNAAGLPHADGRNWPHIERSTLVENGFMVGGASVGHGLLRLYRTTRDRQYLDLARAAGRSLIATAERPAAGMLRWKDMVEPVPPQFAAEQAVNIGWWNGTAGIGMFFLELYQFSTGVDPPTQFSPANP
ncbi:MAG TPA: lanthionine synthetase LanC family protein [Thermoanaerobaculia bacterium]|nr:lanthionine synthetase LanC family protein [Thermoanaerobaculia bacterium]